MTRSAVLALTPLLLCLMAAPLSADIIHVPGDQPTIQAGINAAVDGDTVLVGPGTYYDPIDFMGKEIIVRSTASAAQTIIDGTNHYERAVTFASGEGPGAVLDGFKITNASEGGIWCFESSPVITGNILVHNGHQGVWPGSVLGGGIGVIRGSPTISGNTIRDNQGWNVGGGSTARKARQRSRIT